MKRDIPDDVAEQVIDARAEERHEQLNRLDANRNENYALGYQPPRWEDER